jgi:hypothetical protein
MREPARLTRPVDSLRVIDTAVRILEILKVDEERFILRDTQHQFGEDRVGVVNVWLDRDELVALRDRAHQMLTDKMARKGVA